MNSRPVYFRFAWPAAIGIAALYSSSLYFCRHGVIADGYDGIGFVLALRDFDLLRFQPQPPGYPLYVALGRLLTHLGLQPALALALQSALLLALGLGALGGFLHERFGRTAFIFFLLLCPTAPLTFGLAMATLSDGAGLGIVLFSLVTALRATKQNQMPRSMHALAGALGGLALGFRPPYLLLLGLIFVAIYGDAWRRRIVNGRSLVVLCGSFCAAVLLWLLPLAYVVGPHQLCHLTLVHGRGHFSDFGGSALQDFQPLYRLRAFFSGLYASSFGRLGGLLGLPLLCMRRTPALRTGWALLGLCAAYGILILVTVPVAGHGRHFLPLAVALPTLTAVGLSFVPALQESAPFSLLRVGLLVLAASIALQNSQTAWLFRRSPAPGAALGKKVAQDFADARLYGAGTARYLDLYQGSGAAHPAVYLGEVLANLERLDRLPSFVLLTSEVLTASASRARIAPIGRYCYADGIPSVLRFDRAAWALKKDAMHRQQDENCLLLFSYQVRP